MPSATAAVLRARSGRKGAARTRACSGREVKGLAAPRARQGLALRWWWGARRGAHDDPAWAAAVVGMGRARRGGGEGRPRPRARARQARAATPHPPLHQPRPTPSHPPCHLAVEEWRVGYQFGGTSPNHIQLFGAGFRLGGVGMIGLPAVWVGRYPASPAGDPSFGVGRYPASPARDPLSWGRLRLSCALHIIILFRVDMVRGTISTQEVFFLTGGKPPCTVLPTHLL